MDYVWQQIEYYKSLGCNITDARITAMTHMNTGTASLNRDIQMWLLEYRLLSEKNSKAVLAEGMGMEDGWLTEWGSLGQPYLLMLCDHTEMETSWQRICTTYANVITDEYGTPEMLERYGNEFTAAAIELCKKNLPLAEQLSVLEPPLLTPGMSVGVDVIPDYADDDILIFHGYFGLFVYDLKAEKITFAADLKKAVGTTNIQGSEGAAVRVSADGMTIQLYYYSEQGVSEMAYTIDTLTGSYTYDYYATTFFYLFPA